MFCPRCHREYPEGEQACQYDEEVLLEVRRINFIRSKWCKESGAVYGERYKIRGFVGKGGMAKVYLAEDIETGEPVAIKVLDGAHARDSVARERFMREARAAAMIGHPNIVQTIAVGQRDDGVPFMAMEFLFGETLGQALRREGAMGPDIALPVLQQIASALSAAHGAKVLHRDVKPDNIVLVGEPGEPYGVKIVDFGLAKLREGALTAAGTVVGTIEYMAPEQCITDPADARTDIYGLGVVAYRMFSNRLPFSCERDEELLAKQLVEVAPPLSAFVDIDAGIEKFVARCVRKHPDNRYQSMTEVLVDLERLLEETPGMLLASSPDRVADVYIPRSPFAQQVAKVFYRTLGKQPPFAV
jgi:serine/threonine protein kinase